jgi:hypothetical protein
MKHLFASTIALCCGAALAAPPSVSKTVELADLIKHLMVNTGQTSSKDSYLEMKAVFGKMQKAEPSDLAPHGYETFPKDSNDFFYIYHGRVNLLVKGKPIAADRMQEDASWKVWLAGPKAMVTNVWLRTDNSSNTKAGPNYFRSKGLILDAISCSQTNGGELHRRLQGKCTRKKTDLARNWRLIRQWRNLVHLSSNLVQH